MCLPESEPARQRVRTVPQEGAVHRTRHGSAADHGSATATPISSPARAITNTAWTHTPARTFPGGTEHLVSSKEFPIQTTLTAVKMTLQPGALREMHWHPHADEWQYSSKAARASASSARTGASRPRSSVPAKWPSSSKATGITSSRLGNEPTEILILFNSGDYEEISLTNWLGGNPGFDARDQLRHFPRNLIDQLPKKEVGIIGRKPRDFLASKW